MAVPAKRKPVQVKQPDGSVITVVLHGDEYAHYHATADGLPLVKEPGKGFCYALAGAGGRGLRSSGVVAHDANLRTAVEKKFIAEDALKTDVWVAIPSERRARDAARRSGRLAVRRQENALRSTLSAASASRDNILSSKRKGLVILVNFQDEKMQSKHDREAFDRMFNQEGYAENGCSGSVRDYFYRQSYNTFELDFDVVGPVTVSKNMSYYGGNDRYGNDMHPEQMVKEACQLVDSQVDFSDYDWDGDGEVEQVYVVYAGYGEASDVYGDLEDTIWPHEYVLSGGGSPLYVDGVKVDTYSCSNELAGWSGTKLDGIGTAVHEFSHCLGLPDFYDTAGSSFGMDQWSVMDYGCYGDDGYKPTGYTAYERWFSGWLTPVEISSFAEVEDMKPLAESPEAYVLYNDANRNEYYLLENRQQVGDDVALDGHGLLVVHVDYDATEWYMNRVNNVKSHQRMTIIPADNSLNSNSLAGDPFPGTKRKRELTDLSVPAATLYNANPEGRKYMSKSITNITESTRGLLSFTCMEDAPLKAPDALSWDETAAGDVELSWEPVAGAKSYTVELANHETDQTQTFEGITANACTLSGLAAATYYWRVQAVRDNNVSPFSNWSNFLVETGIGTVEAASALTPETPVTVYAPDGRCLMHTTYGDFERASKQSGVYLIHPDGTEVYTKVYVP